MNARPSLRFREVRRSEEDRILPLINIVFLLLIFFMLAGQLSASDAFRVEPPRSISDASSHPGEIEILIGEDGRLAIDGVPTPQGGWEQALSDRLAESPPAHARIKADGAVAAGEVLALVERLSDAGVERLHLQTRHSSP